MAIGMQRECIFIFGERETVTNAIKKIFILSFLLTAGTVYAQVARSASGGEAKLWAGGEVSFFSPDFGVDRLVGAGVIIDFNLTPKIGAVGEMRWLRWNNSSDGGETQSDYLLGAKYRVYQHGRFSLNAKLVAGGVWIRFPLDIGTGSYFAYAPGGFVDYRLSRKFLLRGDYEYQFLPSAPNIPGQTNNGLTPHGFSVGVQYRVFGSR